MPTEKEMELLYINKKSKKRRLLDYITITFAAIIYGIAVSLFLDPNDLAPGGVTGISIILNRAIGIGTGTMFFILNIPILILGTWKFGFRFIVSTIYCILMTSTFTNLFSKMGALTLDPLLAALAGSCLMAIVLGLVFKAGATTGGTDIIIKILRLKFPYMKTGMLYMIIDTVVVILSAIVFRNVDRALYAAMGAFITSFVLDLVLYGRDGAKLIYIISDKYEGITVRLLKELDIGVTHVQGFGAYSGKEKKVIMCVMRKQLSPRAEEIVKEEDPHAFMIVSSAMEIYGEGYKSYFSEKL